MKYIISKYYFFIYEAFQWQMANLATHLIFLLAKRHDYPVSWLIQAANNFETRSWRSWHAKWVSRHLGRFDLQYGSAWYMPLSANQNGREWRQITARALPLNLRMAGLTRKHAHSRTVIFLFTGAPVRQQQRRRGVEKTSRGSSQKIFLVVILCRIYVFTEFYVRSTRLRTRCALITINSFSMLKKLFKYVFRFSFFLPVRRGKMDATYINTHE